MNKVKKALRLLAMVLFMLLAAFGLGITGVILPGGRERFMNRDIKIEQVDKREDNDEAEVK
ncbi:MAG: hypothetical protein WAU36_02670 [Cyclobacteriaceae bacterium]